MIQALDYFLDRITMYRLVLYSLIVYLIAGSVLGQFEIILFSPLSIIGSALFLTAICWITNKIFALVFKAPTNVESVYITALILSLILSPAQSLNNLAFLGLAAVIAISSKYILAIRRKHIFNPAAIAAVISALALGGSASWWIGTASLLPVTVIGGLLIIRKLRAENLAWSFFTTSLMTGLVFSILRGADPLTFVSQILLSSPLIFFGTIMLTEPTTMPSSKNLKIVYGALVGFLITPQIHLASVYSTPELALIIGNVFSYLCGSKEKLLLTLQERVQVSKDSIEFIFKPPQKLAYTPGQYLEWTIPHSHSDSRGNRRYFTLASSPTEDAIHLAVKFSEKGSSFKKALYNLDPKTVVSAGQLAGDFTLPKDQSIKLAFIAGGIGITPFRSMIKYLMDKKERRDIVLLYANKTKEDIAYKEFFDRASEEIGLKIVHILSESNLTSSDFNFRTGLMGQSTIEAEVPDFKERFFYLSGPHRMVTDFALIIKDMGVKGSHIKKDFFPGFS